ncbi:MAG: DUF357 domain-containing protein [Candidatus Thermoplasmatota archaeon]|nr:DUF357 domain-containing protein [Candidatus Thermoplasmatota archaeon]
MNQSTRIEKDLTMFIDNYTIVTAKNLTSIQQKISTLAHQYYQDAQYYHGKKDYFTAFGCINYAHGLLDAIIKF